MQRKTPSKIVAGIVVLGVMVTAFGLSFRFAPPTPINRDSGVFLYGGRQLLEGKLPYVDFWDHKPPMIFVLNAIGLWPGWNESGVWLLETLLFGGSTAFLAVALYRCYGLTASIVAAVSLLITARTVAVFEGGNFTEGYTLCFGSLLLAGVVMDAKSTTAWIFMGLLGGVMLFTKQNCIAVPLSLGLILAWNAWILRTAALLRRLSAYVLGGLTFVVVACAIMAATGTLEPFWDANFVYTRFYLADTSAPPSLLSAMLKDLAHWDRRGLLNVCLFVLLATVFRFFGRPHSQNSSSMNAEKLIILSLVIEFFLVRLSQRYYGHYFLNVLPVISLGLGIWCDTVRSQIVPSTERDSTKWRSTFLSLILVSMGALTYSGPFAFMQVVHTLHEAAFTSRQSEGGERLAHLTSVDADRPLLVWGADTKWNFMSHRAAPTRYIYLYPLQAAGYDQENRFKELLHDLKLHPDATIVDTLPGTMNGLEEKGLLEPSGYSLAVARPIPDHLMSMVRDYIKLHYRVDRVFAEERWVVYVPRNLN